MNTLLAVLVASTPAIVVPAGVQEIGSRENEPSHDTDESPVLRTTIASFTIDRSEVRTADFASKLEAIRRLDPQATWFTAEQTPKGWLGRCNLGSNRSEHPINCVDWRAARAYCRLRGGDLPTEAEWEHAAKSGGTNTEIISSVQCKERGCRGSTAAIVEGGPRCNRLGICDLFGKRLGVDAKPISRAPRPQRQNSNRR